MPKIVAPKRSALERLFLHFMGIHENHTSKQGGNSVHWQEHCGSIFHNESGEAGNSFNKISACVGEFSTCYGPHSLGLENDRWILLL